MKEKARRAREKWRRKEKRIPTKVLVCKIKKCCCDVIFVCYFQTFTSPECGKQCFWNSSYFLNCLSFKVAFFTELCQGPIHAAPIYQQSSVFTTHRKKKKKRYAAKCLHCKVCFISAGSLGVTWLHWATLAVLDYWFHGVNSGYKHVHIKEAQIVFLQATSLMT